MAGLVPATAAPELAARRAVSVPAFWMCCWAYIVAAAAAAAAQALLAFEVTETVGAMVSVSTRLARRSLEAAWRVKWAEFDCCRKFEYSESVEPAFVVVADFEVVRAPAETVSLVAASAGAAPSQVRMWLRRGDAAEADGQVEAEDIRAAAAVSLPGAV